MSETPIIRRGPDAPLFQSIASDVEIGENVTIWQFVNLYGCKIGAGSYVGPFVEIQRTSSVGKRCKISSHTLICEGVCIKDNVFIGHHVSFATDRFPQAINEEGALTTRDDWKLEPITVEKGAVIGSGSVILGKVVIGEGAIVGAGSVVTKSVEPFTVVAGNPAKFLRKV